MANQERHIRTNEPQPLPGAMVRFRVEKPEGGGAVVTTLARREPDGTLVDTGIPFSYSDDFGVFAEPSDNGDVVYGYAIYWADRNAWEPLPRCG